MLSLQQARGRATAPCDPIKPCCRVYGRKLAARAGVQLDTMKTARTSEVAVVIPTEQVPAGPATSAKQFGGMSMVGAFMAAALAAGVVFNRLKKRGHDMGYNYYIPGRNDPFMNDVMKNVNTVQMDELSPELIAAARARRSRERANHRLDLEDVELPENHPFATRKPMTAEQEAAIQARLQVRPRQRGGPGGPAAGGPGSSPRARAVRQPQP